MRAAIQIRHQKRLKNVDEIYHKKRDAGNCRNEADFRMFTITNKAECQADKQNNEIWQMINRLRKNDSQIIVAFHKILKDYKCFSAELKDFFSLFSERLSRAARTILAASRASAAIAVRCPILRPRRASALP